MNRHAVFSRGAGGKAFCSGGDIKSLRDQPYPAYRRDFFSKEFKMNYRIDTYPKPIISLWEVRYLSLSLPLSTSLFALN